MNILTHPQPTAEPGKHKPTVPEQRMLLHDVSWDSYLAIGNALCDRPALRMTYDRGSLEFMTTSPSMRSTRSWFGRMIETWPKNAISPLPPPAT